MGLIAQLMSGDSTYQQTSLSCLWSFGVELGKVLVQCLDNRVLKEVESAVLHGEESETVTNTNLFVMLCIKKY